LGIKEMRFPQEKLDRLMGIIGEWENGNHVHRKN